jgi:translocation and assembly module TamB
MGVDRLRLALGTATLDIAGKISPALDLTANLRNVTPDIAKPFDPTLNVAGVLAADARLTGTTAAPQGVLHVQASNLRMRSGPAASVPAASVLATIELRGGQAQIDAHVSAGPKLHFAVAGKAPLQTAATLGVHASGAIDLSLLDPILNAGGRRAAGMISLNADVSGTTAAPRIDGTVTLAQGEIQDFTQGVRLTSINARLTEAGDTLQVQNFSAKAGPGTLSLTGSVGVLAPGIPTDLHFVASNARPLASDLLTAYLDADLSVKGQATGILQAGGKIFVRKAEINIPNGLPPSVATLNVHRAGYKPPPPAPAAPPSIINLAITVDAPNNIFVRGHGLDSELGGKLQIAGTATEPQISGGFQMRRGDISVAGTTLTFSKGEVSFDGTSVTGKIDPTLNFIADSTSGSVTATLTVGGYADAPKITLSSVPDLPQDEVLAHLLFGVSVKDLSAIQIAEIASALAELSGVTGGGGDPLAAVRKGLGLDRLSVGSGSGTGTGASVEAGRYVARGVYVGAKQATSGGGTAAEVQIDLTKRLKATAQLATGGGSVQGATPDNDPGSTIGLSYQFEY